MGVFFQEAGFKRLLLGFILFLFAPSVFGAAASISIVPQPVKVQVGKGRFRLVPSAILVASQASMPEAELLAARLRRATGYALPVKEEGAKAPAVIELVLDPVLESLGEEGYQLNVTPQKVLLRAGKTAGLFYGSQTLLQLLPPRIFSPTPVANASWSLPSVQIEDYPRFRWRGLMLDCSRHFMPKQFIEEFIDLMALVKMNSFHWHLTDDQGWRIEIKKYPKLTEIGAWRAETLVGKLEKGKELKFDGVRHGGFYSQDEIREVVAYAARRHINVVPEIEMPGHAQAAIAAYPKLGCTQDKLEVFTSWGVDPNIFNPFESTIGFLQDVLAEVLELFPSPFIHVGGDEAVKTQWKANPDIQARIKELGLNNEEEMQSYFVRRMDEFLSARGRELIGWDEILEGGLAANATVMSWRGQKGGVAAARAGHDVVMAPTDRTYFDYYQSKDRTKEPLAIGGYVPLRTVYDYEVIPKELDAASARHILGTQGQIWTEYISAPRQVEYMAYPRAAALAETAWTPASEKSYTQFLKRLETHLERMQRMGANYRPMRKEAAPAKKKGKQ